MSRISIYLKSLSGLLCVLSIFLLASVSAYGADAVKTGKGKATYTNKQLLTEMHVTRVQEGDLDGHPALVVNFSQALDSTKLYNDFIVVTQKDKRVDGSWTLGRANNDRQLYFTAIKPNKKYKVVVSKGITAKNGLVLGEETVHDIQTAGMKATANFATSGTLLPPRLTKGIPLRVINTPEVDLEFLRVKPENLKKLTKSINMAYGLSRWDLEQASSVSESVYASRFTTEAKQNTRTTTLIPVEDIEQLKQPGLYFVVMRVPGDFSHSSHKIMHFTVSDIGIHLRKYTDKVEVFVSSLTTGKPLSGVDIQLKGKKDNLAETSNDQGRVSFAHIPKGSLLLVAQNGANVTFMDMRTPALDLSEYDVEGALDKPIRPFVYSSRDLFRPGESVDLSVLVRDRDGQMVESNKIHITIKSPDNKAIYNKILTSSELGYYAWNFDLPSDAKTGRWNAEVKLNANDKKVLSEWSFRVEAFMPERMKLLLESEQAYLQPGKTFDVSVQGDYLYGAPAAGNKFDGRYSMRLERHPLPKLKDYYFGHENDKQSAQSSNIDDKKLDDKGAIKVSVPAPKGANSPLVVSFRGNLYEMGGRTVSRSVKRTWWPAEQMVGIRPAFKEGVTEQNKPAKFTLKRVKPDGSAIAAKDLSATLIRIQRNYYWEYSENNGWNRKTTSFSYPVESKTISIAEGGSAELEMPVQYGEYRLEVDDPETKLKSSYAFYAGWGVNTEVGSAKPDKVELSLDKPKYVAGETAVVKILPPSAAEVLITVEADHLLWEKRLEVGKDGASVEIPVDASWSRHDLYITATALRKADKANKVAPNRAVGVIHLPLNRDNRQLALTIEAAEKIRPEQSVEVKLKSSNSASQSAIVTLSAVDLGVLNITRYKTPDPFKYFFQKRRYSTSMYDIYGKIIEPVDGVLARQRFGGDAAASGTGGRTNIVQIVDLFSGPVEFNDQGEATVKLDIPGFDGALRLMAVGFTKDKFGQAEKEMLVSSPVVPALSAPRVLAPGDQSQVVLDLNNTTDKEQSIHYAIDANDIVVLEKDSASLVLPAKSRKTLVMPVKAASAYGVADLKLRLEGGDFVANRQVKFEVRPAWPAQTKMVSHELKAKGEKYTIPQDLIKTMFDETVEVNASISNAPSLNLKSALQGLIQYPYGCLEQTTSRAYPYLFLEQSLTDSLGIKPVSNKERDEQVQKAIARISGMQLSSGAFSLWNGHGSEEYWLTPYVTDFLLDAKDQGFVVPKRLLDQALANLRNRLLQGHRSITYRYDFSEKPHALDFAARAYAAYVLSRVNKAPLGTMRVMFDKDRKHAESGLPLIHLGLALKAQGDNRRSKSALSEGVKKSRLAKRYLGDYGSPIRDDAMILNLILRHNVQADEKGRFVKGLADKLLGKRYLSTQEQVFLFLAGQQLAQGANQDWKANLQYGKSEPVGVMHKGAYVKSLDAKSVNQGVSVISDHTKPLYISIAANGYETSPPEKTDADAISIKREMFTLDGKPFKSDQYKGGALYLMHLQIESKQNVNDALVSDLMPAGLEIENTNLLEDNDWMDLTLPGHKQTIRQYSYDHTVNHEGFLDDRYIAAVELVKGKKHHLFYLARAVSTGSFVAPPAYVEDMYRPEIRGVSGVVKQVSVVE